MKRLVTAILIAASTVVSAAETIKLFVPNGPSHPTTPSILRVLDIANARQNKYLFVIDFKPGGNQTIALKEMDKSPQNTVATIAPAYVENIESGALNEKDYVPVSALGDACWAVVANRPLTGQKEMVIGGVGFGNSAATSFWASAMFTFARAASRSQFRSNAILRASRQWISNDAATGTVLVESPVSAEADG